MEEAVEVAAETAVSGDIVLLSPAAPATTPFRILKRAGGCSGSW
ncbi:MAG: hypothetical protein R3D55_07650 [Chloroflexota bacterium]